MNKPHAMTRRDALRAGMTAFAGISVIGAATSNNVGSGTGLGSNSGTPGTFSLQRSSDGVVTVTLNTNRRPFTVTLQAYEELAAAFAHVSLDPSNRVLVIQGAGDYFIKDVDFTTFGDLSKSLGWLAVAARGRRMIQSFIDVDVPVISAFNGPAALHSELGFLADVVISARDAWFEDPHMRGNVAPGDGIHVVWAELFGTNRARSHLLLGTRITAEEAHRCGAIAELTADGDRARARAQEIAHALARKPAATLRAARYVMTRRFSRLLSEGMTTGWYGEALSALDK